MIIYSAHISPAGHYPLQLDRRYIGQVLYSHQNTTSINHAEEIAFTFSDREVPRKELQPRQIIYESVEQGPYETTSFPRQYQSVLYEARWG
jgi:hypothetical protein